MTDDPSPHHDGGLGRREVIARAAAGAALWTAPIIIGSLASPAGALTGGGTAPPLSDGICRTVSSNTEVQYSVDSGYAFTARAVTTSCAGSVSLTGITPTTTVTLFFPKQVIHYVYLVVESVPAGDCFLYVYEVTSPHSNGSACNINTLVGSTTCAPTVTGSPCGTLQRVEP